MRRLLALLLLSAAWGCDTSTGVVPARPNLILVVMDDLDWASIEHLPRLQRLADEGITFDNFFTPTSICAPSRATYMRGQYAHNHGVTGNRYPVGGYRSFWEQGNESSTLATWLESSAYRTAYFGKYINPFPDGLDESHVPEGWTEFYASLGHYFDFELNENGEIVAYPCCDNYETDVLAVKASDFIRRSSESDQPFFAFIAPYAPHSPATPAPRHEGALGSLQAPRSPSFNEEDVSDKPAAIASRPPLTQAKIDELDELYRERLRTMLAVEEMLDTLLAALESAGIGDETYLFVTSDNGFHYGEHRLRWGKTTAYDEDIRVPLFVNGPGISRGRVIHRFVLNNDIAPTLAELAGVVTPSFVDGRSFVPLLLSSGLPAANWRRGFITQRWRPNPETPPDAYWQFGYRAARTNDYLYVGWDTGERELYDRRTDPYELNNLSEQADPSFVIALEAWLDRLGSCTGSACASAEDEDPPALRLNRASDGL